MGWGGVGWKGRGAEVRLPRKERRSKGRLSRGSEGAWPQGQSQPLAAWLPGEGRVLESGGQGLAIGCRSKGPGQDVREWVWAS